MKQIKLLSVLLGAVLLATSPLQALEVKEVIGGDVYRLDTGEEVRLAGVNTSAIRKAGVSENDFAQEAIQYIAGLFSRAEIRVEEAEKIPGKDGRRLVYLYITEIKKDLVENSSIARSASEETMVNLEIIRRGYGKKAWSYRGPYNESFKLAEKEAKSKKIGMWRP